MLSFKDFITEAGDFSYKVRHTSSPVITGNHGYNEYEFHDHKGSKYATSILHDKHTDSAHVQFANDSVPEHKSMKITGSSGASAGKILSTVHHILKKHAKANPHIDHYHFTSEEPSRAKLYHRYAKSLGGDTESNVDPDTKKVSHYSHLIPAASLRT